jgi:hypothetical protein
MRKPKQREKGESFRPVVTVQKIKKGVPTKISFNGYEYALLSPDQYRK